MRFLGDLGALWETIGGYHFGYVFIIWIFGGRGWF